MIKYLKPIHSYKISSILLILIALCSGCAYTDKLSSQLMPNAEFNGLVVEADAAMQNADWPKAMAKYEQAAQLKPNDLDLKMKQALAYQRAGKLARAHNTYQQIIDAGDKDSKLVITAKANQAKFGFRDVAKDSEATSETDSNLIAATEQANANANETVATTENQAKPESVVIATSTQSEVSNAKAQPLVIEPSSIDSQKMEQETTVSDLNKLINAWSKDWESKRIGNYFAYYSADFKGEFANHKAWRKARTSKILSAKNPRISVDGLDVKLIDDSSATVSFTQVYQSASYQDKGEKVITLKRMSDKWLIISEQFNQQ